MHAPYRIPAVRDPDPPDLCAAYEARLRRRAPGVIGVALLGAFAAGFLAHAVASRASAPSRRAELAASRAAHRLLLARETVGRARLVAEREQARFAAAVGAAADAELEPGTEACPIALDTSSASSRLVGPRAFPLLVVDAADRDLPSPSVAGVLADVRRAEQYLAEGRSAEAVLYANALAAAPARLTADVVVFAHTRKHARRTGDSSFEPGEIAGRAYLYDFRVGRVRCAADVDVKSSSRIEYSYVPGASTPAALDQGPRLAASLDRDLDEQLRTALAAAPGLRVSR